LHSARIAIKGREEADNRERRLADVVHRVVSEPDCAGFRRSPTTRESGFAPCAKGQGLVPEIQELDLNPVFGLPPGQGCLVADVRMRVKAI
jgi:hypothetical protein